jgi:hypothetical protein
MTSFVLSTSAHYPDTRLRNSSVPWRLHASMAGFLTFDSGFTSSTPARNIPLTVRLQLTNSHSMDCTRVPWESLKSMVISLADAGASLHFSQPNSQPRQRIQVAC